MLISVCIATVRPGPIVTAIASVRRQKYEQWELIVVPQGEDPELTRAILQAAAGDERVRLIHLDQKNRCAALNLAIQHAQGEIIAFTDDDCEVAPDWLEVMAETFTTHPDVGCLGGFVAPSKPTRRWTISTCPSAFVIEAVYQPSASNFRSPHGFYMLGANTALRRTAIDRIGRFDATLGPGTPYGSCEDLDYIVRAESMDICIMTTRRSVVYHTYGRRYGLRAFLSHHRNYARGRGAYAAKLMMWQHRLGEEWRPRPLSLSEHLRTLAKNPPRYLKDRFYAHYAIRAYRDFSDGYVLGQGVVCESRTAGASL